MNGQDLPSSIFWSLVNFPITFQDPQKVCTGVTHTRIRVLITMGLGLSVLGESLTWDAGLGGITYKSWQGLMPRLSTSN